MTEDGLRGLARDLGQLGSPEAVKNVRKAVSRTALQVKNAWNEKLYSDGHASLTGRSISYDIGVEADFDLYDDGGGGGDPGQTIVAEIGPRTGSGKQAGIVRLLENGSVHNAPHGYGAAALQENEAYLEEAISRAIAEAAGGAAS